MVVLVVRVVLVVVVLLVVEDARYQVVVLVVLVAFIVEVELVGFCVCVGCGRGVSCEGNYAGYGRCAGFDRGLC